MTGPNDHRKYSPPHQPHPAHVEEGEGNWLVSYADMMTLLVGFFVILLSFSNVDAGKFKEAQKSVADKFGGNVEEPLKEMFQKLKMEIDLSNLGEGVEITQDANGISISFLGTVFFNFGSADVKPEALKLLQRIIPVIKDQAVGFNILVEGHTDNVPISKSPIFRNNWELSSVRACRVLEYFETFGFKKSSLTAVGFADSKPAFSNMNSDGTPNTGNQSKNRRVVIKITRGTEKIFN